MRIARHGSPHTDYQKDKKCGVEYCDSMVGARGGYGYCQKHYNSFMRHGDPKEVDAREANRKPNKKGYYGREHRFTMERHIGRKLTGDETVHHINLDKTDNRIENLYLCSRSKHGQLHKQLEAIGKDVYVMGEAIFDKGKGEYKWNTN